MVLLNKMSYNLLKEFLSLYQPDWPIHMELTLVSIVLSDILYQAQLQASL